MAIDKHSFDLMPDEPVGETMSRKTAAGRKMSVARYVAKAGTVAPVHQHTHEQLSLVLKGRFHFVIDGEHMDVGAGEFVFIPPGAMHGGEVTEDAIILDLFSPPRDDMVVGNDPLKMSMTAGKTQP